MNNNINKILVVLFVILIMVPVILIIMGAVPALWASITNLVGTIFPTWKTFWAVLWTAGIAFVGGYLARKKA